MKRTLISILCLLCVSVYVYRGLFLRGDVPYFGDVREQFLPWRVFASDELRQGRLPLWDPYHFAGSPFLANMQSAVLYPVNIALLPFDPALQIGISLWFHAFLAGLFAFILARDFRVSHLGSMITGASFMACGFFMIHAGRPGNVLTVQGAAWAPIIILVGKRCGELAQQPSRSGYSRLLLWAAPGIGMQILAGHPQMTFYSLVFAGVTAFGTAFGKTGTTKGSGVRFGAAILILGVVVAGGILLSAFQILPTCEMALHSSRSTPLSVQEASQFTVAPSHLIELVIPEFFGTRAERKGGGHYSTYWGDWKEWSSVYFGVLAAFFALYGVIGQGCQRDDRRRILVILAVSSLLMALGPYSPLYRILFHLPGFGHFRAPSKYSPYFILAMTVLCGMGFDFWTQETHARGTPKRFWILGTVSLAISLAGLIVGIVFRGVERPIAFGRGSIDVGAWLLLQSGRSLVVLCTAAAAAFIGKRNVRSVGASGIVAAMIALVDVSEFAGKYPALVPLASVNNYTDVGPGSSNSWRIAKDRIPSDAELYRVMDLNRLGPPEAAAMVEIETVSGYDPMQLGRYVEYIRKTEGWDVGFRDVVVPTRADAPEYDLLNVRWFLQKKGDAKWGWEERPNWLPRAFWLREWKDASDDGTALPVIDREEAFRYRAEVHREGSGSIRAKVNAPQDGYLFFSELFYPGWEARDGEGRELPILCAYGLFRIVPIPAGEREVLLSYRPRSFRVGVAGSIFGFVGWLYLLLFRRAWA